MVSKLFFSNESRCFLFAANNGDSKACISAQTALGYLYSGPEICDLQKAFQWHSDACGNGSVESQGFITKHRISF
uniref:Protein Wnt n=1 Tax=Schistosoma mansoni TaxID=6183 RepID=A0A5K4F830_SCHMA